MKKGPPLSAWGLPLRLQWRKRRDGQSGIAPDAPVLSEMPDQIRAAIAALLSGAAGTAAFEEISAAIVATILGAIVGLACFLAATRVFRRLQWRQMLAYAAAVVGYVGLGLPLVIYVTERFYSVWPRLLRVLIANS